MKTAIAFCFAFLLATTATRAQKDAPQFALNGPMIVAFFAPDPDVNILGVNESLDDFRSYAERLRTPLSNVGIEFRVVYTSGFSIRYDRWTVREFGAVRARVGYVFIEPFNTPRQIWGVRTDTEVLRTADDYFGIPATEADQAPPRIEVSHPTVVAFFAPALNDSDPDEKEALAGFRAVAVQIREPLKQRGIEFREVYGWEFVLARGKKDLRFSRPTMPKCGYVLISPQGVKVEKGFLRWFQVLGKADEFFGPS